MTAVVVLLEPGGVGMAAARCRCVADAAAEHRRRWSRQSASTKARQNSRPPCSILPSCNTARAAGSSSGAQWPMPPTSCAPHGRAAHQLQAMAGGDMLVGDALQQMLHTVDRASPNSRTSCSAWEQGGATQAHGRAAQRGILNAMGSRGRDGTGPLIAAKRLDFALEGPDMWAPGDAALLGELMRNLLANAIHHTPVHGRLGCCCATARGGARCWCGTRGLASMTLCGGSDCSVSGRAGGVGLGLSLPAIAEAMGARRSRCSTAWTRGRSSAWMPSWPGKNEMPVTPLWDTRRARHRVPGCQQALRLRRPTPAGEPFQLQRAAHVITIPRGHRVAADDHAAPDLPGSRSPTRATSSSIGRDVFGPASAMSLVFCIHAVSAHERHRQRGLRPAPCRPGQQQVRDKARMPRHRGSARAGPAQAA